MNKFEMLIQMVLNACKSGNYDFSIPAFCDIVDEIKVESVKRGYIKQKFCDDCGAEIVTVNLQGQYRTQCDCKKGIGHTEEESFNNWLAK